MGGSVKVMVLYDIKCRPHSEEVQVDLDHRSEVCFSPTVIVTACALSLSVGESKEALGRLAILRKHSAPVKHAYRTLFLT